MQVNSERAKCSGKPLSPPVPAKQSLARGGLVIVAQHPSSSSFYSNRTTTSTTTNENSRRSTHRRVFSDTTTAGLTASLRRKFSSVKNSGLALRRSISSATKPSKSTRSKSESLGQGSKSGMRHLQGRAASSAVSLSPDICEGGPAGLCSTPSSHPRTENPFESDSESEREMDEEDDVKVPLLLQQGTPTIKVSAKKRKIVTFRIDADEGYILWESKKSGIIPIENIKEIRSGADARYYREQFQLSAEYETRWLTIVYIADGRYKTLHMVTMTADEFTLWDKTLRALFAVRQELMSGLGHVRKRQSVWERRYWRGADEQPDNHLSFDEVERMCRRMNISFPREELLRRFIEADTQGRNYLNFNDFRRFVKLLKQRPELTALYDKLRNGAPFSFAVFREFMTSCQKSTLPDALLAIVFEKYAAVSDSLRKPPAGNFPPTPPSSEPSLRGDAESPAQTPVPMDGTHIPTTPDHPSPQASAEEEEQSSGKEITMSLDSFITFLLSNDNSIFADHHGQIWQDMTRPLSDYYISSSHNTYLVGHQLVGVSTIEGYIRALLHSCRSVEIDVYDGETEPVIYHGKTLTSKVSLRDICQAINKYAFVASPYPIIISAEIHCCVAQQDVAARIMREVFGDALVSAPVDARPEIIRLPSPEDLRGRVLLKAKSLYVSENMPLQEKPITLDTESSSTSEASSSDAEFIHDIRIDSNLELSKARNLDAVKEIREEVRKMEAEAVNDIKDEFGKVKEEFGKARNLYDRVRRRKSPSPAVSKRRPLPHLSESGDRTKVKISFELAALLVYTIGVKCRGINKKETYAPNHMFSLSERTANKVLKQSMLDLVKHNRTHLVRIYPNGTRLNSTNFEPHRYWAAGAQLVAINWQTFDLGYMINNAMFQRNGRAGYVLKPDALRNAKKDYLTQRTNHLLNITIISAQQLPRRKDSEGREIVDSSVVDPYVEVSVHIPDWARSPFKSDTSTASNTISSNTLNVSPGPSTASVASTSSRVTTARTGSVKKNGFNPRWEECLSFTCDVIADMRDLVFVRFSVRDESASSAGSEVPLAVYCCSLGSMQMGYRHLPLHDAQLSQYLFSTLFVHVDVKDA